MSATLNWDILDQQTADEKQRKCYKNVTATAMSAFAILLQTAIIINSTYQRMVVYVTRHLLGVHFPIVVIQSEWITCQVLLYRLCSKVTQSV